MGDAVGYADTLVCEHLVQEKLTICYVCHDAWNDSDIYDNVIFLPSALWITKQLIKFMQNTKYP